MCAKSSQIKSEVAASICFENWGVMDMGLKNWGS